MEKSVFCGAGLHVQSSLTEDKQGIISEKLPLMSRLRSSGLERRTKIM